jgi:hypothetical protein
MSVEIVLVPLAIAAVTAWKAGRVSADEIDRTTCQVATRMRDEGLLEAALASTGANVSRESDAIVATWRGVVARMTRDSDGIWTARLHGDVDVQRAVQIMVAVDEAYGRQVQQAVVRRLKERAPTAGLQVQRESVGDDDSVTLLLAVERGT